MWPAFDGGSGGRGHKKPWRYRWVDEDRDKVLARLLELNRTRAEEEAQSASLASAAKTAARRVRKATSWLKTFRVTQPGAR